MLCLLTGLLLTYSFCLPGSFNFFFSKCLQSLMMECVLNSKSAFLLLVGIHFVSPWYIHMPSWLTRRKRSRIYLSVLNPYVPCWCCIISICPVLMLHHIHMSSGDVHKSRVDVAIYQYVPSWCYIISVCPVLMLHIIYPYIPCWCCIIYGPWWCCIISICPVLVLHYIHMSRVDVALYRYTPCRCCLVSNTPCW